VSSTASLSSAVRPLARLFWRTASGTLARAVDFVFGLIFVLYAVRVVLSLFPLGLGRLTPVDPSLFVYIVTAVLFIWQFFLQAIVFSENWFESSDGDSSWFTRVVTGYYRAIYTAVTVGVSGFIAVQADAVGMLSVGLAVAVCLPPAETALSRRWNVTPFGLVAFVVLLCYVPLLWVLAMARTAVVHTSDRLVEAWRVVSDSVAVAAAAPNPSDGSVLGIAGSWVRHRARLR
jgi:hypothetical protein